ncbi:micu-1, partial [Pristionchus pacificus]
KLRYAMMLSRVTRSGWREGRRWTSTNTPVKKEEKKIDPISAYTPFGGVQTKESKDPFFYSDRKVGSGYSHFSSSIYAKRPYIWPPLRKLFNFNFVLVIGLFAFLLFDFEGIYNEMSAQFKPQAGELKGVEGAENSEGEEKDAKEEEKKKKKSKNGFRERRIIEYEDRLRTYSSPDKIFRYFATLKMITDIDGKAYEQVLMTPEDFVRSFTPGVMQPRKYGLDKFKLYDPTKKKHVFSDVDSIFYQLGENGLITYSDYLFLMTLLSTSPKDFEVAFQIFDINGDGALDVNEFRRVQELVMSQTMVGQKHRDRHSIAKTSPSFQESSNSVLERYFFGPDRKGKLAAAKFLEFQARLHRDVLRMELIRRSEEEGREEGVQLISYESFAHMLIQYAELSDKKKRLMLKRLRKRMRKTMDDGITFDEVQAFFNVIFHIDALEAALHFHKMAGMSMSARDLERIIKKISNVDLPEDVVFVAVTIFDENGDGRLSNDEFVAVVRRRLQRGLERPRDTGLFRFIEATVECTKKRLP